MPKRKLSMLLNIHNWRFLVPMRHDYIIKPVSTLKRHEVAESIASASVWRRGAGMFSNKVDLMETLISWVVCRTLILLLRYSIVGTTIILWNCVAYHVREADMIAMCTVEYSFLIYYSVNLRSDVYFFRLVALLHSCFLHSQPSLCSVWVGFGLSFGGSCSFAHLLFGRWRLPVVGQP